MTPQQEAALAQLMQLLAALSSLNESQSKMIEQLLEQNNALLARLRTLDLLAKAMK